MSTHILTRQEKIKVFQRFVGARAICLKPFRPNQNSVDEEGNLVMSPAILADLHDHTFQPSDFKLKLISPVFLLNMEALEIADILGLNYQLPENNIHWAKDFVYSLLKPLSNYRAFDADAVIQYLYSKQYDIPLWLGVSHPANGYTASQLGLADFITSEEADIKFVKNLLPNHYSVKSADKGASIRCISPTGIVKSSYTNEAGVTITDAEDEDEWKLILEEIKAYFGQRFSEVFHNVCSCHVDFVIYTK